MKDLRQEPENSKSNPNNKNSEDIPHTVGFLDYESSAVYIKNEETGLWEVRNPSSSTGYNYLYRDDYVAEDE